MGTIYQEVLEKGKEIGVKEGEEKNKLRVALNLLMMGMDIQAIAKATELDIEKVESLKSAIQAEHTVS